MADPEVALNVKHLEKERTWRSRRWVWPSWWRSVFTMSCLLSVSVDPLFLYIPITNQDMKCLRLDQNLMIVTLLLRSAMDLPYILHIIFQIILAARPRRRSHIAYETPGERVKFAEHALEIAKRLFLFKKRLFLSYFHIDILAILPIPQVVILILLARTKVSKSLSVRKFLNFLIVFQYLPRTSRMLRSRKAPTRGQWFRVYKFILVTHVVGAFWYFFSIQREMDCWQSACGRENRCEANTFYCGGNHTFKNITFLNIVCPISAPNPTVFNFGIFLEALQSGISGSTNFSEKFLYCFLWGLRSLSSFGQNLQTSTYAWENLFVLGITVAGMILFLIYLSAILQVYLHFVTKLKQQMKTKGLEVDLWLFRKGLPRNLKPVIMHIIQQKLEQNKDVEVENILTILPSAHSKYIKRYLRLAALKEVPMLQTMGVNLLKAICEHLEPVDYPEDSCIIKEGERLDKMIFITHGTVQTYKTNCKGGKIGSKSLEKGNFYGAEELLNWASKFSPLEDLPTSTRMVKTVTKVEAFLLSADDLKSTSIKYWWNFTKNKELSEFDEILLEEFAVSSIEKEIRRRRQAKKKRSIGSLNKLDTNVGNNEILPIIKIKYAWIN